MTSGYNEPNKDNSEMMNIPILPYFQSKYHLGKYHKVPRDPPIILGADLSGVSPLLVESKDGQILYFSRLSHNFIVANTMVRSIFQNFNPQWVKIVAKGHNLGFKTKNKGSSNFMKIGTQHNLTMVKLR